MKFSMSSSSPSEPLYVAANDSMSFRDFRTVALNGVIGVREVVLTGSPGQVIELPSFTVGQEVKRFLELNEGFVCLLGRVLIWVHVTSPQQIRLSYLRLRCLAGNFEQV